MNIHRALRAATLIALLAPVAVACGSAAPRDPDADPRAPSLPLITTRLPVSGEAIDAARDKVDWRTMTAAVTGDAKLVVTLPEEHALKGDVGIFLVPDGEGEPENVALKAIAAGDDRYVLAWSAEAGRSYLFRMRAASGASSYEVSPLEVKEPPPPDPCADVACDEDKRCEEGQCVAIPPAVCTPACKAGKVCVEGECVTPCGGPCGKGMYCNRSKNECMKDPCAGKVCPAGEKCSGGICKAPPKPCGGACAADEKCVSNKCEKAAAEAPASGGPVTVSIQQVVPEGAKTTVILSAGTNKGIKKGDTGSISGVPGVLRVIEVFEYRSKARIDASSDVIGNKRTVVINR
jgi:hypothetical protein